MPDLDAMRALLHDTTPHGPHCGDPRYDQWARQVAECTHPHGHPGDHTDTHTGKTWT